MKFTHYTVAVECFPRYKNARKNISDIIQRTDKLRKETFNQSHQTNMLEIELKENVTIYVLEMDGDEKLDINGEILEMKTHDILKPITYEYKSIEAFLSNHRQDFDPSTILIVCEHQELKNGRKKKFHPEASFIIMTRDQIGQHAEKSIDKCQVGTIVSSKKDIAAAISALLEQAAFKPLKEKFEYIRSLINENLNKSDDTTNSGQPKRNKCSTLNRCRNKRKFDEKKEHEKRKENGFKMVTRFQDATSYQNSSTKRMKPNQQIATYILKKEEPGMSNNVSEIIEKEIRTQTKQMNNTSSGCCVYQDTGFTLQRNFGENKAKFQRLLGEMIGMYRRSKLPESLKPGLDGPIEGNITAKIMRELYKISSSVKGYSYKFIVRLQIHVMIDDIERLEHEIARVLNSYGFSPDSYDIVPPLDDTTPCNKILVGSTVTATVPFQGSLACIVKTTNANEESNYCALASKHLLRGRETVELSNADRKLTARVVKETAPWDATMEFDIAAAEIQPNDEIHCDGRFKTEDGTLEKGEMSDKNDRLLECQKVHINGASTPLGLGIIASTQYRTREQNEEQNENSRLIYIEERFPLKPFCREGDSGAMVCADNEDGKHVELISTVNGKTENGLIATLRIQEGISHLQSVSRTNIEFI